MRHTRALPRALVVLATMLSASAIPICAKAEAPSAVEDARQHYKRGVDLYGEANYTAALIEFRRAYEIAPNFSILYNIGQIHYQLHDYAEALKTFQAYLSEGGNRVPSNRRTEVEREVAYLRDRVGYVEITSNAEGAELMVDGVLTGKSPFTQPVIVTVGRRRLELMKNDRVVAVKALEVAAGDHVKIELNEPPANAPAAANNGTNGSRDASSHDGNSIQVGGDAPAQSDRGPWPAVAWTATGVFAVGTIVTGVLALGAASDLKTKRETEGTLRTDLDSAQSKTKTLALVADVFGIATVLAAGTATYLTVAKHRTTTGAAHLPGPELNVRLGLGSAALSGTF